jgi:hypothetical protein
MRLPVKIFHQKETAAVDGDVKKNYQGKIGFKKGLISNWIK